MVCHLQIPLLRGTSRLPRESWRTNNRDKGSRLRVSTHRTSAPDGKAPAASPSVRHWFARDRETGGKME